MVAAGDEEWFLSRSIFRHRGNSVVPMLAAMLTWLVITTWAPAEAQTVGYSVASNVLTEIDLETGAFAPMGSVGTSGFTGLTMSFNGSLWGVSDFTGDLWRIDPMTAASTRIGAVDVGVDEQSALTVDACGRFWLVSDRILYELDPGDASTTLVMDLSMEARGLTSWDGRLLALAGSGTDLIEIDPDALSLVVLGDVAAPSTLQQGLDFDLDGNLWGVFWKDSPILDPFQSTILQIDPADGSTSSSVTVPAADVDPVFEGNLAIAPPFGICDGSVAEIPITDPTGRIFLVALLAMAGLLVLQRL